MPASKSSRSKTGKPVEARPKLKPVRGTTIGEDGKVYLKPGYQFIRLSDSEFAVGKPKASAPKSQGGVSTRHYEVEVTGSYECRCSGLLGPCSAAMLADPITNQPILVCTVGARRCRRGCNLILHYQGN